jgi:beta-phosphoglucomutase-like phosphatase (HAD superfamily)
MSAKRLTGRQALAVWPERLAGVNAEPTDENLQRLCSLLDAIDRWVVQRWGTAGHDDRRTTLAAHRREAREANRYVSATARARQAAAGTANLARRRQQRRRPTPAGLEARSGSTTPQTPPGAVGASRGLQGELDGHDGQALRAPVHAEAPAPRLFLEAPQLVDRDPADCVVIARRHGVASAGRQLTSPPSHALTRPDALLLESLRAVAGDVVSHPHEAIPSGPTTP